MLSMQLNCRQLLSPQRGSRPDWMPKENKRDEMQTHSKEVCLQGIRLLHKKKRQWEAELEIAKKVGRAPVASESYQADMKLLEELQKQSKAYSDAEELEEELHSGATSSDARAAKNDRGLKGSFGLLTQAVQQVSAFLQHDESHAQAASQTLTTAQLKINLAQLDSDIQGGLQLENGERALVRELCLKKYANGLGNQQQQR